MSKTDKSLADAVFSSESMFLDNLKSALTQAPSKRFKQQMRDAFFPERTKVKQYDPH